MRKIMDNDIIEEIKKGLTGNASHDANYLHDQAMKYRNHENSGRNPPHTQRHDVRSSARR